MRDQEREVMMRYGIDDAGPGLGASATCLLASEDDVAGDPSTICLEKRLTEMES